MCSVTVASEETSLMRGCGARNCIVICRDWLRRPVRLVFTRSQKVTEGNEQVVLQSQDSVLSWVMERLGVAAQQAEDIILRDYLLSAAGQYNCRGGGNGRVIAVLKSDLMDLETLTDDAEGDRAQAEPMAWAA